MGGARIGDEASARAPHRRCRRRRPRNHPSTTCGTRRGDSHSCCRSVDVLPLPHPDSRTQPTLRHEPLLPIAAACHSRPAPTTAAVPVTAASWPRFPPSVVMSTVARRWPRRLHRRGAGLSSRTGSPRGRYHPRPPPHHRRGFPSTWRPTPASLRRGRGTRTTARRRTDVPLRVDDVRPHVPEAIHHMDNPAALRLPPHRTVQSPPPPPPKKPTALWGTKVTHRRGGAGRGLR